MALALKHQGFGKWLVLSEDGDQVAGPMTKEEAEAFIAPPSMAVDAPAIPQADERAAERAWAAKLDAAFLAGQQAHEEMWLPWLTEKFGEEAARRMWADIAPILKAGSEYRRRERLRFIARKAAA